MNISIEKFSKKINEVINKISNKEKGKIQEVAKILSKKYLNGSHLYIFGTGHNHCIAEESLHRAGAFAGVTPMLDKKIDFSEGITKASKNERDKSLAKKIFEKFKPLKGDSIIIFSNSGVNQLPIEISKIAKKKELFIIGVLSIKYANSLLPKSFKNLSHFSDIYINNYSPIGDTIFEEKNFGISSSSTIAGIFILNSLWAEMYKFLKNERPLPFYKSSNLPKSNLHNKEIENKFKNKNIFLK
jgi:uncharacterized phosphosugar-binding protein